MTTAGLRNRLKKLQSQYADPEVCDGGVTVVLTFAAGDPLPSIPPDALRCTKCGQPHVLLLEEVVVESIDGEPVEVSGPPK